MILETGICSIFRKLDVSGSGDMPKYEYKLLCHRWYGELGFETSPARPTEGREEIQTDARIRILQNRMLLNHDVVVLANVKTLRNVIAADEAVTAYEITRAFHGRDDQAGEMIPDLTLRRMTP